MLISIAVLRRLLRVLAIFLLRQPPDLQIFCWMILFQGCPRTPSNPFCTPKSMYSESAYRSKVAKSILGAKYPLSREQHVAEENVLQSPGLEPFWSMSPFESAVDLRAKLHFITAVLLSFRYSMSCLAVTFHLVIPQKKSHARSISQIITGCLPPDLHTNRICSPCLTSPTYFSPTSQLLGQLAPLFHLRDGLPLVSLQRPSDSSSSP